MIQSKLFVHLGEQNVEKFQSIYFFKSWKRNSRTKFKKKKKLKKLLWKKGNFHMRKTAEKQTTSLNNFLLFTELMWLCKHYSNLRPNFINTG